MELRRKKEEENFFLFQQKFKNTPVGLSMVDILDMFRYSRADVEEMVNKMIEKNKTWSIVFSLVDRWSTKEEKMETYRAIFFFNIMVFQEEGIGELKIWKYLNSFYMYMNLY